MRSSTTRRSAGAPGSKEGARMTVGTGTGGGSAGVEGGRGGEGAPTGDPVVTAASAHERAPAARPAARSREGIRSGRTGVERRTTRPGVESVDGGRRRFGYSVV